MCVCIYIYEYDYIYIYIIYEYHVLIDLIDDFTGAYCMVNRWLVFSFFLLSTGKVDRPVMELLNSPNFLQDYINNQYVLTSIYYNPIFLLNQLYVFNYIYSIDISWILYTASVNLNNILIWIYMDDGKILGSNLGG